MQVDAEQLRELAAGLCRRFPRASERAGLLQAAEIDLAEMDAAPERAWIQVVEAAHAQRRLAALVGIAAARMPDDALLQAMSKEFNPPIDRRPAYAAAIVGFVVLTGLFMLWFDAAGDKVAKRQAATVDLFAPIDQGPVAPADPPVDAADPALAPVEEPDAAPVVEAPDPIEEPADPVPEAPESPTVEGRCGGPRGAQIGFWYAGFPFDAQVGDVYTLNGGKHVRSDWPGEHNGWNAQEPVQCGLKAGDQVRITADPVLVDGGKYWVPLHAGDLLTP
jgi:hypothetical protein